MATYLDLERFVIAFSLVIIFAFCLVIIVINLFNYTDRVMKFRFSQSRLDPQSSRLCETRPKRMKKKAKSSRKRSNPADHLFLVLRNPRNYHTSQNNKYIIYILLYIIIYNFLSLIYFYIDCTVLLYYIIYSFVLCLNIFYLKILSFLSIHSLALTAIYISIYIYIYLF